MLDRLDSAFKAEKSFVSHASHELNNPITAIQENVKSACSKKEVPKNTLNPCNEFLRRVNGCPA